MHNFVTLQEFQQAQTRIAGVAVRTPLLRFDRKLFDVTPPSTSPFDILVKDESTQPIGSFKIRGSYNMAAQLSSSAVSRGLITYSSGNHAQGVAYAAKALGTKAVIVMPQIAPIVKQQATAALGAELVLVGSASAERRRKAEQLAVEAGYTLIPPYDAREIIAGQGTCGLEILEQFEDIDHILVPVGGGGLLSGIAAAVKQAAKHVSVWGVEPELAADAGESFRTRTLIEWPAEKTSRTCADGVRTQSLGKENFRHILQFVDGFVTVSEEQILSAMRALFRSTQRIAEPSGAVALAAAMYRADQFPSARKVAVVMSGGNLDTSLRERITCE